jgi:hypothetical protein
MRVFPRFIPLILACAAIPALASTIRDSPVPERMAEADVVVLGKVTLLEKTSVTGADGNRLRLVRVNVEEDLLGTAGKTPLRVGFIFSRDNALLETPVLRRGQKVCLFLTREKGVGFYRILGAQGAAGDPPAISEAFDEYEKTVAAVRRAAPLLRNLPAGLVSKNPEERMLTAWMLTVRYRKPFLQFPKTGFVEQPIDARESRRILENLTLLADKNPDALWTLFWDLGLEPWNLQGVKGEDFAPNARKWLQKNAGTWRLRKRVPKQA